MIVIIVTSSYLLCLYVIHAQLRSWSEFLNYVKFSYYDTAINVGRPTPENTCLLPVSHTFPFFMIIIEVTCSHLLWLYVIHAQLRRQSKCRHYVKFSYSETSFNHGPCQA